MAKASAARAKGGLRLVEQGEQRDSGPVPAYRPRGHRAGVVEQVRAAFARANLLATLVGCVFGGFVPAASFVVSHYEVPVLSGWHLAVAVAIVVGGLVVSARTVYAWALLAFADRAKAVGFTVLLEGVMTFAAHAWLSAAALALVVLVNGVAAGCRLSGGSK